MVMQQYELFTYEKVNGKYVYYVPWFEYGLSYRRVWF